MMVRRRKDPADGETPLLGSRGDLSIPEGRIQLGAPPDIDVANDRVGALLLERRRALGLKVEEIAEEIKIKADYVRAIESEEFDRLPTLQYARLFVKTYAERLGFNVAEICALLDVNVPALSSSTRTKPPLTATSKDAGGETPPLPTAVSPAGNSVDIPSPSRRPSARVIRLAGTALIVVLLWLVWYTMERESNPVEQASGPTTAQVPPTRKAVVETPPPNAGIVEEPAPPVPLGQAESLHLVLQFDRDTWASLHADGKPVINRVFGSGERTEATAADRFRLSLGHTYGVTATMNGYPLKPFSAWANLLEGQLITRDSAESWLDTAQVPGTGLRGDTMGPAQPATGEIP